MQVQTLRYFVELARVGSFYGAAKQLGISQQGLNKAITALEAEMGCELVERSRRGVQLTLSGEILLRRAERIVDESNALERDLANQQRAILLGGKPLAMFVSYYCTQIANPAYVRLLSEGSYIEEPFDKLVARAAASDGTELVLADLHAHSMKRVLEGSAVLFEPIIKTQVGLVWKEGSTLAPEVPLHRADVARLPLAINTFREMAQLTDRLFRDTPLEDVRFGVSNPHMQLRYVQESGEAGAIFDSFSFYLAKEHSDLPTDGLHFTPLAAPESICLVGFLHPKGVQPILHTQHIVGIIRGFLLENCRDYLERYPVRN